MSLKKLKIQWSSLVMCIFLMSIFNACSRNYTTLYHPNEAYMMGVSDKGDLKVAAGYISRKETYGWESSSRKHKKLNTQVAYSPIKNLVVTGSHYRASATSQVLPVFENLKNTEFSIGYYNKMGMEKETDKSYFLPNIHVGMGSGNIFNQFETAGTANINYTRSFLHGGAHFGWKKNLSFGVGLRYAHIKYKSVELTGKIPENDDLNIVYITEKEFRNVLESSFQIQGGANFLKVYVRATAVFPTSNLDYPIGRSNASLGVILELDEIWEAAFRKK